MLERLIGIDQDITLWLNGFHSAFTDPFWMFLSDIRIWFPAYGAIMGMMIYRLGWKKGLVVILSCVLTVVLADQISAHIKDGIGRLRPCYSTWMLQHGLHWPLSRYSFFGFFSGHASNAFGFAVCSWLGFRLNDPSHDYKVYGWCALLWAFLVAVSRVMMAAHYFGDILVGTVFGIAVGLFTAALGRGVIRRWLEPAKA
ncbi:MAG: phosphatase PAP2 family protein [Bacteroidales bacterium]|jgi:undecaprenyl-diphosphatase|nr:phosphatase PAP2 family protein [Bacteroidales bacterium]